jgi:DNA topoisomerase I
MEDELDAISRGEEAWVTPLEKFWKPFIELVEKTEKTVSREEVAQARELGMHPELGRPISVRMGRFGAFVQAGTKDDVEKPKFAGLKPGMKMDTVTLAEALELFKLPRDLGPTADGEPMTVAIGRFGPYIKFGAKYVSLKDDDPYTVTPERAIEVIEAKKLADANRIIQDFADTGIQVLNGRYGPYITDKERNARIPKDRDPKTLTLEECRALLEAAPLRPARGRFGRNAKGKGKFAAKTPAKSASKVADAAKAAGPKAKVAPVKAKAKAKAKKKKKAKAPAKAKLAKPTGDAAPAGARKAVTTAD